MGAGRAGMFSRRGLLSGEGFDYVFYDMPVATHDFSLSQSDMLRCQGISYSIRHARFSLRVHEVVKFLHVLLEGRKLGSGSLSFVLRTLAHQWNIALALLCMRELGAHVSTNPCWSCHNSHLEVQLAMSLVCEVRRPLFARR